MGLSPQKLAAASSPDSASSILRHFLSPCDWNQPGSVDPTQGNQSLLYAAINEVEVKPIQSKSDLTSACKPQTSTHAYIIPIF